MKRNISKLLILLLVPWLLCLAENNLSNKDYTEMVDPIIGTDWHGHTFPGPVLPHGMIQLSPDTKCEGWDNLVGYHYDDTSILGFTHTRYSGPGAGGGLDILFMPTVGYIKLNPGNVSDTKTGYRSKYSHEKESASPGYYSVLLEDYGVLAELTATKRIGFHKYTFPKTDQANIILDLVHGFEDTPDSLFLAVSGNKIYGYRGASTREGKYNLDLDNVVFFAAKFSKPLAGYGIAVDGEMHDNLESAKGKNVKGYFRFNTKENESVLLKIAISMVSIEGARKNLEAEMPGWDFNQVRENAKKAWNKELSKIDVTGGTKEEQTIFYTALYHALLQPNLNMDVDRQYRSTNRKVYTATDFTNYTNFSLWDQFRGLMPLHTIINQQRMADYLKVFEERYRNSGGLPKMEFSGFEEASMIGYHSLSVIADAYVKGFRDFDIQKIYEGMKQLADNSREQLVYYKKYGFIPYDTEGKHSVSRTLEYSFDDWCITRLAKDFSDEDYNYYSQRGKFYKNVFSEEIGFMRPRNTNYTWVEDFDPAEQTGYFTEANSYQYSTFALQDIEGLIELMGGDKSFDKWLDVCFNTEIDESKVYTVDMTGTIGQYAQGNEPDHHLPYLYNYAGTAWKTQELTRRILTTLYSDQPDGLIGNDDLGQMSAWYVLSAMGFYSVTPGMDYYVIGSPLFDKVTLNLENGNTFEIVAKNNGADNVYIQSAELNGKSYSKTYLKHGDIMNGGKMVFEMAGKPNKSWGSSKADRPYSDIAKVVPMPKVSFADRLFIDNSIVSLSCEDENATICYTLDGSEPDENSTKYKRPFAIDKSCILKARCFITGMMPGYPSTTEFKKVDIQPAQNVSSLKPGLKYIYKEGFFDHIADMEKYPVLKSGIIETINIDSVKDARPFGYHFNGFIHVPVDGLYGFNLKSNDGAVFYLDDNLIIDNDGAHRAQESLVKIGLKKGFHSIKLDYFQQGRAKSLVLRWEGPGIKNQEITKKLLFHKQ